MAKRPRPWKPRPARKAEEFTKTQLLSMIKSLREALEETRTALHDEYPESSQLEEIAKLLNDTDIEEDPEHMVPDPTPRFIYDESWKRS